MPSRSGGGNATKEKNSQRVPGSFQSKFRCLAPKGTFQATTEPITKTFTEFFIATMPDPEDLFEDDDSDFEGIPDLAPLTSDDSSDSDSSDSDSENEEIAGIQWPGEEHSDEPEQEAALETEGSHVKLSTQKKCTQKATANKETRDGKTREAPTVLYGLAALKDLKNVLNPPRKKGPGYVDPKLDVFVWTRLEGVQAMLNFFTNKNSATCEKWAASSFQAAISLGRGRHCARQLQNLARQFILDRKILPINPYGDWNQSMLLDEGLVNEIQIYLQSIGPEISGQKLMEFLADEDLRSRHGIEKPIKLRTAQRYLNALGYRYKTAPKGQYTDGHERADVVFYRNQIFLPQWRKISDRMTSWAEGNLPEYGPPVHGCRVIAWFHDESIFYANDRRKKGWYHKDATAKPYTKGEGASIMIADFVSADFGWLRSPDEKRSARRVMRPGKNRDGYFSNDDIREQAEEAMDILEELCPQYDHVLIYDNATTHLKRAEDALLARHMPKNTPKPGHNWGIEVSQRDPVTGKKIHNPDGSPVKIKVRMGDAHFADSAPQSLYFSEGHERAGVFKGMVKILEERGFENMSKVRAECKGFKCAPEAPMCCCRRILFNQPDFASVKSVLETACHARGFQVMFLPKFHCELNFIEQCWGYAKRVYRLNPPSSREDQLEKNALAALDAVPLTSMRKFAIRSRRFMNAYERGLNGHQAAWAA